MDLLFMIQIYHIFHIACKTPYYLNTLHLCSGVQRRFSTAFEYMMQQHFVIYSYISGKAYVSLRREISKGDQMKKAIMIMLVLLVVTSMCASAFTQLGSTQHPKTEVLSSGNLSGKTAENINLGMITRDVTKLANISAIFGAKTTAATAAEISISGANGIGDKWVEISNLGATSTNMTGWALKNQENLTYTFPVFVLEIGSMVRINGGMGVDNNTALYTNSLEPLVNDTADVIVLLNASGAVVDKYEFNATASAGTTSTRNPELQPLLIDDNSTRNQELQSILVNDNSARNPELEPILMNDNSTRDQEKMPLLINS
jgi:hypothetical protein